MYININCHNICCIIFSITYPCSLKDRENRYTVGPLTLALAKHAEYENIELGNKSKTE